jgi:hypothetical protein
MHAWLLKIQAFCFILNEVLGAYCKERGIKNKAYIHPDGSFHSQLKEF